MSNPGVHVTHKVCNLGGIRWERPSLVHVVIALPHHVDNLLQSRSARPGAQGSQLLAASARGGSGYPSDQQRLSISKGDPMLTLTFRLLLALLLPQVAPDGLHRISADCHPDLSGYSAAHS